VNLWLLLNKSSYYFNGDGGWIMEHAHTVNWWPETSTRWKHYLAAAHRLRMASWNTFMATETLVRGRASWMNTRLAHNWPACCHGNLVWNNIWLIRFGAFLRRDWPRPIVPDRLVRIRKLVKFINQSLALHLATKKDRRLLQNKIHTYILTYTHDFMLSLIYRVAITLLI